MFRRDRGRCVLCGTTRDIHAHHVRYLSEGGRHTAANLVLLCGWHHNLGGPDCVHSNKKLWQPILLQYLRRRGYVDDGESE